MTLIDNRAHVDALDLGYNTVSLSRTVASPAVRRWGEAAGSDGGRRRFNLQLQGVLQKPKTRRVKFRAQNHARIAPFIPHNISSRL